MMRRAAATLLVLATAACTTGPNYAVPGGAAVNRPTANGAFASGHNKAFTQAELPDHWWQLYGDPRLDGFVVEALAANTDLRAADANLRRADEVVRQVAAQRTVSTSVGGGASLVRASPPSGVGGGLPGTAFYDTSLSLAKAEPVSEEPRAEPLAKHMAAALAALKVRECSHKPERDRS